MNARKTLLSLTLLCLGLLAPSAQASFGIKSFSAEALKEDGSVERRAGAHPAEYSLSVGLNAKGNEVEGEMRELTVELPPGMVGNPLAVPRCSGAAFEGQLPRRCPGNTQIGIASVGLPLGESVVPIYNMTPTLGSPARFGFSVFGLNSFQDAALRTGSDYGINVADITIPTGIGVRSVAVTIWGVPSEESHDAERTCPEPDGSLVMGCSSDARPLPFLTLPTSCTGPLTTTVKVSSLEAPNVVQEASVASLGEHGEAAGMIGCEAPPFEPTIAARPESSVADSPTGLHVGLHVPQHEGTMPRSRPLQPLDEVQEIEVHTNEAGGGFSLLFGAASTPELPFNASAAAVQSALEALSGIGTGNVTVSGGPANSAPLQVTFGGALGDKDVAPLELRVHSAAGGSGGVTTLTEGRPTGTFAPGVEAEIATAHLRDLTLTLPQGLVVNPSSANGLGACSSAQIDLHGPGPAGCPADSKIGTVEATTPAIDHPLKGALYLAKQGDNPFGSLLALYLTVEDPVTGIVVKLAGKVEPDSATGQLKTVFPNNPQLPIEDVDVEIAGGPRAPLTTPPTCGRYTTTTDLVPWTSPAGASAHPSDSFAIDSGPGGACANGEAQTPNRPSLEAGTSVPLAGSYSPLLFKLSRENGSQRISQVNATLPPGLVGRLAGLETCSDSQLAQAAARNQPGQGSVEKASPSCPSTSEIGTVTAGAGSGAPLYVQGKAYLAGPYKGAPLSFAFITPALAGPFDLGTIVVRAAAYIDPLTAQITVSSDPIPQILDGIPLDIRSIAVSADKPQFTLNPTNCDPLSFGATAISAFAQSAALSNRFQVGGCRGLGFEPKLALRLKGGTKRGDHPQLIATLAAKEGQAGIQDAQVKLPPSAFLDQAHIRTVCTRVQFAAGAGGGSECPPGSIYGHATARTPLLGYPISGNVYLRSSNHKLPDLLVAMKGPASQPIEVELAGRTDSVKGALRNSFEALPDAPVSSFSLELLGGRRGLVVNSRDICKHAYRATVKLQAHSGKSFESKPLLQNDCAKQHQRAKKRR